MSPADVQDAVYARYKLLRTQSALILSLDVFYFFACYLTANLSRQGVYQFTGLLQSAAGAIAPVLLKYIVLVCALASLPVVIYKRRFALGVRLPGPRRPANMLPAWSVESACTHYRRVSRAAFVALSCVNLAAGAFFIAYGKFWLLALVSYAGFLCKIIIFPGANGFGRWVQRVLEAARARAAT